MGTIDLTRLITFHLTINWQTYFLLVITVLFWNLGFYAITRKGKLFYFILKFFTQKKQVEVPVQPAVNTSIDTTLLNLLLPAIGGSAKKREDIILDYFKYNTYGYYSKDTPAAVYERLTVAGGRTNQYYFIREENKLPDWVIDPIVVCITCMASVHGVCIFILYCRYFHIPWNPIIQLGISVPVAYLGELFWYLKLLIEKHK